MVVVLVLVFLATAVVVVIVFVAVAAGVVVLVLGKAGKGASWKGFGEDEVDESPDEPFLLRFFRKCSI